MDKELAERDFAEITSRLWRLRADADTLIQVISELEQLKSEILDNPERKAGVVGHFNLSSRWPMEKVTTAYDRLTVLKGYLIENGFEIKQGE